MVGSSRVAAVPVATDSDDVLNHLLALDERAGEPPPAEADVMPTVAPPSRTPVIDLFGIAKTYRMGNFEVHAVQDISLQIGQGEYVAVVGPSGSGNRR